MRPIDADALKAVFEENSSIAVCGVELCKAIISRIDEAPTVDAVPVRHGKWIEQWRTADTRMLRCSECKMVFNAGNGREGNYCPNCGARMAEE